MRLIGDSEPDSTYRFDELVCLLIGSMYLGSDGPISQVGRMLGAAASVSEAAGDVVAVTPNATSSFATSTTDVIKAAAHNTSSFAANTWHGVDLLDLQASRCGAALVVDSEAVLRQWLRSKACIAYSRPRH